MSYKSSEKYSNFLQGFMAAVQLEQRAGKDGHFIEVICLSAMIIDGFLRIGIILKHQLETKSMEILNDLLYQKNEDKIVKEREIYQKALEKKIISEELFQKLEFLYLERNKVIHRYIISGITTSEVLNIALQYEQTMPVVGKAIKTIEDEQIRKGVGMTRMGEQITEEETKQLIDKIAQQKHDSDVLNNALKLISF